MRYNFSGKVYAVVELMEDAIQTFSIPHAAGSHCRFQTPTWYQIPTQEVTI